MRCVCRPRCMHHAQRQTCMYVLSPPCEQSSTGYHIGLAPLGSIFLHDAVVWNGKPVSRETLFFTGEDDLGLRILVCMVVLVFRFSLSPGVQVSLSCWYGSCTSALTRHHVCLVSNLCMHNRPDWLGMVCDRGKDTTEPGAHVRHPRAGRVLNVKYNH
jgi:hypothetical protein